jgi:gas vesicle protein
MSKKSGLGKFVLGAGLGAGLALLFAPKKGTELRRDIKKKIDAFMADVDELTVAEIKEEFTNKVDEIKKGIENLDKETVLKAAKKKGEELKEKTVELVELAKEKGLTHIAITNHDTVKGLKEQNDDLTYQISRMNNEKEQIEKNILDLNAEKARICDEYVKKENAVIEIEEINIQLKNENESLRQRVNKLETIIYGKGNKTKKV